jgi:hypothetical protein
MSEIRRIPNVMMQAIVNGGSVSGVAPAGAGMVDSAESLYTGQYRKWTVCAVGGLFQIPADLTTGWRLARLVWHLPGVSGIKINLVDEDAVVYEVAAPTTADGQYVPDDGGLLVLPGWAIKVVGTNVLTSAGRVVAFAAPGWRTDAFEVKVLGEAKYPPPKQP